MAPLEAIQRAMKCFVFMSIWTVLAFCIFLMYKASSPGQDLPAIESLTTKTGSSDECHPNLRTTSEQTVLATNHRAREHIYYLKNHKTGSTTMYFILAEYCRSKNLLPLVPVGNHINNKPPFLSSQLMLDPKIQKYDMVFNHHVYTPKIFQYLHNDTFRFTTLRQPLSQFVSAFYYFRNVEKMKYLAAIPDPDPLSKFLANPQEFEAKGYASFTNNRQSVDLGFSLSHSFNDSQYIKAFIAQCERNFDLILITDYFEASVVLLKRTLRWQTGDVVYLKKNSRSSALHSTSLSDMLKKQHERFSTADIPLYNHFQKLFKIRISRERDLQGEVDEFKTILCKVRDFCNAKNSTTKQLIVPPGRWSDQVNLLRSKCKWLRMDEILFTKQLRHIQKYVLLKD